MQLNKIEKIDKRLQKMLYSKTKRLFTKDCYMVLKGLLLSFLVNLHMSADQGYREIYEKA